MLKWGGGLPSARHLISTRSPSFSIPSGSTSSHTLSAGSAQAKGAALSPRASRTQPHSDGSVLTENRDSDLPRFLHVVPTGQPIAELAVKLGIFVLLGQLCLQNAPQGVQTTRLHDLGRLDVDPWAGRKGRRARPQLRLQPHPMISWVGGMAGEPLYREGQVPMPAAALQPSSFLLEIYPRQTHIGTHTRMCANTAAGI